MGFYIRKSFSLGPIRFNLSRSGLGASVGVKGARFGIGPKGQYIHLGRGGLYYRRSLTPRRGSSDPVPKLQAPEALPEIDSAGASSFVDSDASSVLNELKRVQSRWQLVPILLVGIFAFLAVLSFMAVPRFGESHLADWWLVGAVGLVSIPLLVYARRVDVSEGTAFLTYDLTGDAAQAFSNLMEVFRKISSCEGLWYVEARAATDDWKRNAGVATLIARRSIRVSMDTPWHVRSNISVPLLPAGRQLLYFFPDRLLLYDSTGVGTVEYADLVVQLRDVRYAETGVVPRDTRVVGQTWQYVAKAGGPDRRFNSNRQIPMVLYGECELTSSSGLHVVFQCSDTSAPTMLSGALQALSRAHPGIQHGGAWKVLLEPPPEDKREHLHNFLASVFPGREEEEIARMVREAEIDLGGGLSLEQAHALMLRCLEAGFSSKKEPE